MENQVFKPGTGARSRNEDFDVLISNDLKHNYASVLFSQDLVDEMGLTSNDYLSIQVVDSKVMIAKSYDESDFNLRNTGGTAGNGRLTVTSKALIPLLGKYEVGGTSQGKRKWKFLTIKPNI